MEPIAEPMYVFHVTEVNNTSSSQDLEPLVISYAINQLVNLQL